MADATTTRTFNLLSEPWIPVRRRSGRLDWIRPAQLVEREDPPMAIETSRADFDAGVLQFLIALLQTIYCPEDEDTWVDMFAEPPTLKELDAACERERESFWLDGPGPRYMQEQGLSQFTSEGVSVQDFLGEALASRLFFKAESVERFGLRAAAMALTTLQMHAWGGGRGYKTALRGAGAISTVLHINGGTLFQNVWINVLSNDDWQSIPGDDRAKPQAAFPWMAPARPASKEQENLLRVSAKSHRAVHFWAMPRRLWLLFEPSGTCDLVGEQERATVSMTLRRPYGLSYEGAWQHPLSPHKTDPKDGVLYPARVSDARVPYKEWPDLMLPQSEGDAETTAPAAVVRVYRVRRREDNIAPYAKGASGEPLRVGLRIFGYQMPPGQAKVFGWLSQGTPLLGHDETEAAKLSRRAAQLVQSADKVRSSLVSACRAALRRRAEDIGFNASVLQGISRAFWARTEPAFVASLEQFRALQGDNTEKEVIGIQESWLRELQEQAIATFFEVTKELASRGDAAGKRVALARDKLKSETSVQVPWLREAVGLVVTGAEKGRAAKEKKSKEKSAASVSSKRGKTPVRG